MYSKLQQSTQLPSSSQFLFKKSSQFLTPFLSVLSTHLDKRLVRNFQDVFMAILGFRERHMSLLLSELGAYIMGPSKAPAGTKRISNLLRSKKWTHQLIDKQLLSVAHKQVDRYVDQGKRPLFLWDDSRIEKHESWFLEGLCSVSSSKGQRLARIKKGFYKPVGRICVPGFQWTGVVLSALHHTPTLLEMRYWTTRGKYRDQACNILFRMMRNIAERFGQKGLHIFDRGFATSETLEYLLRFEQNFLIRWVKNRLLINEHGVTKKLHWLARSYKGKSQRLVNDKERKTQKKISIAWASVKLEDFKDSTFYLIIIRDTKSKQPPVYLLTSLEIQNKQMAWEMCFSYMKRWDIEQIFRFAKSEMGLESPRLWFWENRLKLMAIVGLVIAFLLTLLICWATWCRQFIQFWCHRTGNRCRNASTPIYRLRLAISYLLQACWGFLLISG